MRKYRLSAEYLKKFIIADSLSMTAQPNLSERATRWVGLTKRVIA